MVIENKTEISTEFAYPVINMPERLQEMKRILAELQNKDIINRIWHKDHTVWKTDPTEISNRLGWLQIIDNIVDHVSELEAFADVIRKSGYHHVVLLGMGGSSLGPEVLRQTFGSGPGYPAMMVLDSTHPAAVEAVTRSIEPRHTLFLVSSKSGSTVETNSLYRYFRDLVNRDMGKQKAGANFVAITDAQTSLALLAEDEGFRQSFINPADIGGRYSVLSYFGLLPAALIGIDIKKILEVATKMQESCAPCVNVPENPGAWLGVLIGSSAMHGRNKLTFIISPSIRSFGLWVEQLVAESTGKEGTCIIPIIDEPVGDTLYYGDDRLFVYLRLKGDVNERTDEAVMKLEAAGQPIIQLELKDQNEIGAAFFRWEFATAVAGAVLKVNPFDQPDVQSTKDAARQILKEFKSGKRFPPIQSCETPNDWLDQAGHDDYLAITAYLKQTPATDKAFAKFRQKVMGKYHIATTLGYGPRFLHSTGQLHKGGLNNGLFFQITTNLRKDLPVPGESFTFGELTDAEASGDFQALKSKGRKVIRLQLCSGSGAAIERMVKGLG
jgi:glucose-6-phosphate isomerase